MNYEFYVAGTPPLRSRTSCAHATAKRRSYSVCRAAHAAVPASGPATKVGDVLSMLCVYIIKLSNISMHMYIYIQYMYIYIYVYIVLSTQFIHGLGL